MDGLPEIVVAFVTLLLLPTLGVLGLLEKRAIPVLAWTLGIWAAIGAWVILAEPRLPFLDWGEKRFLHTWVFGLCLGGTFLVIAWLRSQPRVANWLKLVLGVVTVTVFLRSLYAFVMSYA